MLLAVARRCVLDGRMSGSCASKEEGRVRKKQVQNVSQPMMCVCAAFEILEDTMMERRRVKLLTKGQF
jgi:hypothetical protein